MKYWINRAPKEHTFIAYADRKIYRLLAKPEEIIDIRQQLDNGRINDDFMGVPENYLRYVEFQENEPALSLHYGKDTEDKILVSDLKIRREIFEHLREYTSESSYENKRKSFFERLRKPGIGLLLPLISIASGVFYFLWKAQQEYFYTVEGIILILLPLIGLCIYLMMKASGKNVMVERLLYKRN